MPLGWKRYAIICVDDFTRFKFDGFLSKKSGAKEALRDIINDDIAPEDPQINIMRTDGEGKFDGQFQTILSELYSKDRMGMHWKVIPGATNHGEVDT